MKNEVRSCRVVVYMLLIVIFLSICLTSIAGNAEAPQEACIQDESYYREDRATKFLEPLDEKIAHGGHPVLRWMVDNIFVKTDPAGNIKPDKEKSMERIDGAVAMIMALDRAIRHMGDTGSVYNGRGLLLL